MERLRLPEPPSVAPRAEGDAPAYLVTGAGGPFALRLAEELARRHGGAARLLLAGSPPPDPGALTALEEAGAEVATVDADTATADGMAAAFARAAESFGDGSGDSDGRGLAGVLHVEAGFGERFARTTGELSADVVAARLGSRVEALGALADEVRRARPRVCLLSSSLAGVLGGLGVVTDAAADAFTDRLARAEAIRTEEGDAAEGDAAEGAATTWVSVAWDAWQGVAGAGGGGDAPASNLARTAMSGDEAAAVLDRVLSLAEAGAAGPQVLVSAVDLEARLDRWVRRRGVPEAAGADAAGGKKQRPALTSPFVPPKSELERLIAEVWRELFGFEEIGVYDDFYELGGHSLLGTQVAVRLRESLKVDLPLRQFLEYTTISDLAKAIAARQVEQAEPEDLDSFLAELEAMSDEEATARAD